MNFSQACAGIQINLTVAAVVVPLLLGTFVLALADTLLRQDDRLELIARRLQIRAETIRFSRARQVELMGSASSSNGVAYDATHPEGVRALLKD